MNNFTERIEKFYNSNVFFIINLFYVLYFLLINDKVFKYLIDNSTLNGSNSIKINSIILIIFVAVMIFEIYGIIQKKRAIIIRTNQTNKNLKSPFVFLLWLLHFIIAILITINIAYSINIVNNPKNSLIFPFLVIIALIREIVILIMLLDFSTKYNFERLSLFKRVTGDFALLIFSCMAYSLSWGFIANIVIKGKNISETILYTVILILVFLMFYLPINIMYFIEKKVFFESKNDKFNFYLSIIIVIFSAIYPLYQLPIEKKETKYRDKTVTTTIKEKYDKTKNQEEFKRFYIKPEDLEDNSNSENIEKKATDLKLTFKNLTDIPEDITYYKDISELDLSYNNFSKINKNIIKLEKLEKIILLSNKFEIFPDILFERPNLKYIDLSWNSIAQINDNISDFNNLETLLLKSNRLLNLPDSFKKLKNLKKLSISYNKYDSLPLVICEMTNLTELDISLNCIKELPQEVKNLTKLKKLDWSANQMLALPPEIGLLKNLESLNLFNNVINKIPAELTNLTNLKELEIGLYLDYIPHEILELRSLERLKIKFYFILKSVPENLTNLKNLKELDLKENEIDDNIIKQIREKLGKNTVIVR